MKTLLYSLLVIFVLYTIYKIVLIYVLNVSSIKSNYIYHSRSIETSKTEGLYVATYHLDKNLSIYNLKDSLLPIQLFIEKEKVVYPQFYFYCGKSEIRERNAMDASGFLKLTESGSYDITCPVSTLPNQSENIDKYRKRLHFF